MYKCLVPRKLSKRYRGKVCKNGVFSGLIKSMNRAIFPVLPTLGKIIIIYVTLLWEHI